MNPASYADLRSWLNPRLARGWLALLFIVYTLAGFFLVPWVVQTQLPVQSQALINRTATAEAVAFNPFALRLRVAGFRLADSDDATLATAEELLINLQLRSLLRFAIVLGDAELIQPNIYLTRFADNETNIGRLLAEMEAEAAAAPAEENAPSGEMFRLIVDNLRVSDGVIVIEDRAIAEPFVTRVEPVNISLANLSTLPDDSGVNSISIETETGSTLTWSGDLAINPLRAEGRMTVSGSPLGIAHRYLREQLNFRFDNCCLDISLDYLVESPPGEELRAAIDNLDISIRELRLRSNDEERDIVLLPELELSGGSLRWPDTTVSIDSIRLNEPFVHAWTDKNRLLNLTNLIRVAPEVAPAETSSVAEESVDPAPLPDIRIGSLTVNGMSADFTNFALDNPGRLELAEVELDIRDLSTRADSRAPVSVSARINSGGAVQATGSLTLAPEAGAQLDVGLDDFALAVLQPWVEDAAFVAIDSGRLTVQGSLEAAGDGVTLAGGAVSLSDLQISDARLGEPLAGWQQLQVNDISAATAEQRIGIGSIRLASPFGRLLIDADGGTNFGSLGKPATDAGNGEPEDPAELFRIRVGKSIVEDGRIDFTDESLPLPFGALITEFGGDLSAFDTDSGELSTLNLRGKVGDFGLSTITGELNLTDPTRDSDIRAEFRNVSMPETSPYTVDFVGQKIASGKLDLDLQYRFEDRKVKGDNDIVLRDFKLGDKVDHPDAMDLPLGLAVGLLRDVNGEIDMNLKVSGDLDDPSFSARNLILKAFANLITKAVAAPFKLLGALVPELGDKNASRIAFAPGSAELLPPELEKLRLLATALEQRPGLVLRVPGGSDVKLDTAAFQQAAEGSEITPEELTRQLAELGEQRQVALLEELRTLELPENRILPAPDAAGSDGGYVTLELGLEVGTEPAPEAS